MKRFIISLAALALAGIMASAQYRDFIYDTPSIAKLVQIDDYEDGSYKKYIITVSIGGNSYIFHING